MKNLEVIHIRQYICIFDIQKCHKTMKRNWPFMTAILAKQMDLPESQGKIEFLSLF